MLFQHLHNEEIISEKANARLSVIATKRKKRTVLLNTKRISSKGNKWRETTAGAAGERDLPC